MYFARIVFMDSFMQENVLRESKLLIDEENLPQLFGCYLLIPYVIQLLNYNCPFLSIFFLLELQTGATIESFNNLCWFFIHLFSAKCYFKKNPSALLFSFVGLLLSLNIMMSFTIAYIDYAFKTNLPQCFSCLCLLHWMCTCAQDKEKPDLGLFEPVSQILLLSCYVHLLFIITIGFSLILE